MKILVTGGAGFIGRWVVDQLLQDGHHVWVLDDLSNGRMANIRDMQYRQNFMGFTEGDIKDKGVLTQLFTHAFDICYHLAASINVQDSIDDPGTTFDNDVVGTFRVLEQCRHHNVKIVFMSTCMVYERARDEKGMIEANPVKPASPYAGSKLAAENMVMSYYYTYGLPATIIRPFNTYGPYQKTDGEGGVVAIFLRKKLAGKSVQIYGDGVQTRDLMYVEDCAQFVVQSGYCDKANGEIINAGSGQDVSINNLAHHIMKDESFVEHITHIHPQSEIPKLLCDYKKAKELLNWEPEHSLEEGIQKTEEWLKTTDMI